MESLLANLLSPTEKKRLSFLGIKKSLHPRTKFTGLERRYYHMLKSMDVFFIPQYPLCGRYFDAYLPEQNILFEFDGSFWHPKEDKDCKYGFQKKNMKVDELKNTIAKEKGMKIIRIREEAPITENEMKALIWG
jgi:very-short-patch-repair endonuclease